MQAQFKVTCREILTKLINTAEVIFNDCEINVTVWNVLIDRIKSEKDMLKTITKIAMLFVDTDKFSEECHKMFDYEDSAVVCISKLELLKVVTRTAASVSY